MSTYDAQIEQAKRDMESAEDQLAERGEISVDSWMLIKSYVLNAILQNTLLNCKAMEESISSLPTAESSSSTPQFQTGVKS